MQRAEERLEPRPLVLDDADGPRQRERAPGIEIRQQALMAGGPATWYEDRLVPITRGEVYVPRSFQLVAPRGDANALAY